MISLFGDAVETLENVMFIDFETWKDKRIKIKHREQFSIYLNKSKRYQTAGKRIPFHLPLPPVCCFSSYRFIRSTFLKNSFKPSFREKIERN